MGSEDKNLTAHVIILFFPYSLWIFFVKLDKDSKRGNTPSCFYCFCLTFRFFFLHFEAGRDGSWVLKRTAFHWLEFASSGNPIPRTMKTDTHWKIARFVGLLVPATSPRNQTSLIRGTRRRDQKCGPCD